MTAPPDLDAEEWRRILDAVDAEEPPALELAEQLADAVAVDVADAQAAVYDAVDDGPLVEDAGAGGAFGGVRLAAEYRDDETPETPDSDAMEGREAGSSTDNPRGETAETGDADPATVDRWDRAGFDDPDRRVWAPARVEYDVWMCRSGGKAPYAPWTDADAPVECGRDHPDLDVDGNAVTAAECDHHAGYKWGSEGSHEYVHECHETAREWAEMDPSLSSDLAFIQRERDPFAFVDGDDVRDPETGDPHPAFVALLEHLGVTYADVSTSGAGVHAVYRGSIPLDGVTQATFEIDTEPWGANDDVPEVEIYTGKKVCVATGDHVRGSGTVVEEWDTDALASILAANGYEDDPAPAADTAVDLEGHDPTATTSAETTDDIRDVFHALDRLDARRVAGDTIVHAWNDDASTSAGNRAFVPEWGRNANGTANIVDDEIWQDTGGRGYGGVDVIAAVDCPDLPSYDERTQPGDLRGADWFRALEHLRDLGYDVPEYDGGGRRDADPEDVEQTAVLPPAVRDLSTAASGWDWRHTAAADDDTLDVADARERTVDALADAYERGDRVLLEALPTMGKSYGAVKAAARTGEPITLVTGRGRKEQYEQFREWCDEHGLDHYTLPSFTHDCDTANGEHGEEDAEMVRKWYGRGATPKEIHKSAEYVLDRPLPCQEREGATCPYASKWDFDPDDYDVLIGHYNHAHKSKVTSGRTVVVDEFPDAYETVLGPELQAAVSYWLETTDGVPFDSYTDLIEHRDDESRRADALLWFEEHGLGRAETDVLDDPSAHADAPLAAFTLLASDDLGNGFETADLDDVGVGVFDRSRGAVSILQPPALEYASGVVALDGTPTKQMWELALGERLNHRPVLQDDERAEYVRDALNLNFVRTSEYVKPYNSADHVYTEEDAALLEAVAEEHDTRPSVITTSTAEAEYDAAGVLELVDETKHYGNVLGSNEFDDTRVGAVIGSNHYGDGYIKKWGAYAGDAVERGDGKGSDLSYSGFGDDVLQHMREHDTLQAAMRFGRDGNGAVVYVHTDTLPEWVPVAAEGRVLTTWSDGRRGVLAALEDLGAASTAEIVDHPAVDVGRRAVFDHLEALRDRGVLDREQDTDDGRRVVWVDDGVHRLGDHGDAELDPVDLDDLDDAEVQELARSSIYTWEFRNSDADTTARGVDPGRTGVDHAEDVAAGADPPPDPAD